MISVELARMTSKGQLTIPASIRRKLGAGTGDQILFYEKNGRIVIANASPESLADAQEASAENHVYTREEIIRIVSPIAEEYKVDAVYLFGSYARGEARPDSDMDFLISRGELRTLFQLGGLQAALSDAFHKKVDVLPEDSLTAAFRQSAARDEVKIYERTR